MGTGFAKKKKEAKLLREQMTELQKSVATKLENLEVEGAAGNGLVTIVLNGSGAMKKVSIKPECVDPEDIEGLEALIKAAHQDAFKKVQEASDSGAGLEQGLPDLSMFGF